MAETCPGWKSSTWMFWFGKRQQRKGVGECEGSVTKAAPTRIFHPMLSKFYEHLVLAPKSIQLRGFFTFFFLNLSGFDYKQNLL